MKLAILHLSDIHFRDSENSIIHRTDKIVSALCSADPLIEACMVAITGDIAFSGKRAEYDRARHFVNDLRRGLQSKYGDSNIWFVSVPGNHDCDFSKSGELRSLALSGLAKNIDELKADGEIARCLLTVQSEFFVFAADTSETSQDGEPWLFREHKRVVGEVEIRARCFNTAFASTLAERQGELFFPVHVVNDPSPAPGRVVTVSLFHHPYPWLEADNGLRFKKRVETSSDVVLTGHMHSQATYTKSNLNGAIVNYHEGAVLQGESDSESGFSLVVCDTEKENVQRFEFGWTGDLYVSGNEDSGRFFQSSKSTRMFDSHEDYRGFLQDPGVGFSHPRKTKLLLPDIFVYPDLSKFSLERQGLGRGAPEAILSDQVSGFVQDQKKLLVLGADQSGRTALAKTIYLDLQRRDLVPIMLSGPDLRGASDKRFLESVRDAVKRQYSQEAVKNYDQLAPNKKVLILDDWHRANLNAAGKALVVDLATRLFDRIVLFTGELFRVEEISGLGEAFNAFRSFQFCEIREFGHYLRGQLIKKWHCLGRELTWSEMEREYEINKTEKTISQILGKNLLPSSPVTVLSVLQALEASKAASTPSGSYGYLYEVLITSALTKVNNDSSDLDLKYTFISRLAFHQFSKESKSLSRPEIEEVIRRYFDEYSITIPTETMLSDLEKAQVLSRSGSEYCFRYKYIYYYFVARFFSEGLRSQTDRQVLQEKLGEMANQVYFQEYASILIFVLYLTKDSELIRCILANADKIFGSLQPCDFKDDVNFINRLYKEPARVLVPSIDVERNREQYRRELDRAAESDEGLVQIKDAKVEYSESLDVFVKVNIAVKTLQLLGQVLRNFPGSLRKELKTEITRSCYLLGLRLVRAMLDLADKNLELFRNYVAELIRNHRPMLSDQELAKTADEAVIWLTRRAAFGIIKTISYAVGLEILQETYREVLEASGKPISFRLIDVSVKLDHFATFPEDEVEDLWEALRKNSFSATLLRDLVAHYLYLFPLDYRKAQRIGAALDIQINAPQLRNPRTKKLKS